MNESPASHGNVVETNDSLDAVGVFRGWKNVFFGIVLVCMLLSQAAFWLVNLGIVALPTAEPAAAAPAPAAGAGRVAALKGLIGGLDFELLARAVELINGVLIVAAVLLAASIFFGLLVSLVGRLGGLNHISRAFVLALITVALLIPWHSIGLSVLGVTWTPAELIGWLPAKTASLASTVIFYLRFSGYWAVVALLLLLCQARSTRWSKAILHRLEII